MLPIALRQSIDDLLEGVSTAGLAQSYQDLSLRYRRQDQSSLQIRDDMEALAYMAARLPATYAAMADICSRVAAALPDFTPRSLLDLGAGPGTATLAALDEWPGLSDLRLIEPNPHLRAIAAKLLPASAAPLDGTLQSRAAYPADLVVVSYVLNELAEADLEAQIARLWADTQGVLIIAEPGTPLGYDVVLRARAILLALGAHLVAPCPHALACPLQGTSRWCHFSVRAPRSSLHRRIKGDAGLGYEDEKFSYLAASREPVALPRARLIGHPHGSKLVELELCESGGQATTRIVSKRDDDYKKARKASWGDAL